MKTPCAELTLLHQAEELGFFYPLQPQSCFILQPKRGFILLLPQHTLRKTQQAEGRLNFGLVNLENVPLASHHPHVLHVFIHICK